MHTRRWSNDRLHENIPIEGGDLTDLIYVFVRWLITLVVNDWQS
jgi:hypothetical protein